MYSKYGYAGYYGNKHKVRDATISKIFEPFRVVLHIVPALAVLKLCGVVDISWLALGLVFAGYEVIDYVGDLLQIAMEKADLRQEQELHRIAAEEMKRRCTSEKEEEDDL